MKEPRDDCMGCGKPADVEVIARPLDSHVPLDRTTLCHECAIEDLGGALIHPEARGQAIGRDPF